jgi:hypothetical protein
MILFSYTGKTEPSPKTNAHHEGLRLPTMWRGLLLSNRKRNHNLYRQLSESPVS